MSNIDTIKQCCKLFSAYNVKQIYATYDGSGDSGDLEIDVMLHATPSEIDNAVNNTTQPSTVSGGVCRRRFKNWGADIVKQPNALLTATIVEEFEDALFELLPGGWEINEGSYGEIHVDIASEQITVEHNERYTEVRSETFNY